MKTKGFFTLIITVAIFASNFSVVFAEGGTGSDPVAKPVVEEAASTASSPEAVEVFQENENTEVDDFSTSELPENWVVGGDAELTGNEKVDAEGDGWLRLTGNGSYALGYAFYDTALSTENGLAFKFDYTSWGGSGADGITFFLMDGETSADEFNAGGVGGSIGYAPRHQVDEGLSNAVVGIAFDEFGNYSTAGEGRVGGTKRTQDSVAIRGAGDGFTGYAFVDGTEKQQKGIDIRNTKERPDQTGRDYRNVSIIFTPVDQQFALTLNIQYGTESEPEALFSDLVLPGIVPATIKFGFTATSGGSTNFHEVRNLIIDKAVLNDVQEEIKEEEIAAPSETEKTVFVPVKVVKTGDTLTIIPVTGSEPRQLSCNAKSKLDIFEQVFAILPAMCDHQATLALEPIKNITYSLPSEYTFIKAASLMLAKSDGSRGTIDNNKSIKVGFFIDEGFDAKSLTILVWESGRFVEKQIEIENGYITTTISQDGLLILVQK